PATTTSATDVVVAGGGDDVIDNVGNADIVYGQAGDDTFEVTGAFKRIDGGDGVDTLALSETVDLGNMQPVAIDNIEVIDLQNLKQDILSLNADAIRGMVDGHNELAGMDNALVLVGEPGDVLQLHGDFVAAGEMSLVLDGTEMSFRIFTEGDVSLLVSDALGLEIVHTDGTVETIMPDSMLTDSIDLSGLNALLSSEQIETSTSDTGSLAMSDLLDGGNTLDGLLGSDGISSVDPDSGWTESYAPSSGDPFGSLAPMDSYSFDI
ncbi:MAG: hypothetical protein HUJ31_18865, partial [Pseudomonadales bacterium]|nr:hypothetical protein [Pseudomonadales bacterium]